MSTDSRTADLAAMRPLRQAGVSLVELVLFIIIVSVAVVGVLSVMNLTTGKSADPLIRKQALAIAESLLEEISLQPFTYCIPTDDNALTANSAAGCTGGIPGSEDTLPAAARVSNTGARNALNVADYANFSMNPIVSVNGAASGLAGYAATVAITQVGGTVFSLPVAQANDVLQVDVTVTHTSGETVRLTGYRFRYAPRALP